jgi:predicted acylesterase/phospholipase RssA
MIEHLVLSGAGPYGMVQMGIFRQCIKQQRLVMANVKSVHATSAGALLTCVTCLGVDIEVVYDYFLERPWNKWANYDLYNLNTTKGLLNRKHVRDMLAPLFQSIDLPVEITMAEAFAYCKVPFYFYATDAESMQCVEINHESFPDMPVIDAVAATTAAFPVFAPVNYGGKVYLDGALRENFPMLRASKRISDLSTVLAINVEFPQMAFGEDIKLLNFMFYICHRAIFDPEEIEKNKKMGERTHYIGFMVNSKQDFYEDFLGVFEHREKRLQLLELGAHIYEQKCRGIVLCSES